MVRTLIIFTILILSNISFSQTQLEMNEEYGQDYQKADKKLNEVYQNILKLYTEDELFINNLKIAQRLWIQLRDAQLEMKFPEREPGYYGSVFSMCKSSYLEELTNKRIKELEEWIEGCEEGDVCCGSVKRFY